MPELPEVETIVQQLNNRIKSKEIIKIKIVDKKKVDSKIAGLTPVKIKNIYRKGKSIILELGQDNYFLVHLRMTGHFHYFEDGKIDHQFDKYILAKFYFSNGSVLTYNSIRKFGGIKLLGKKGLNQELTKLGVEPLSPKFNLAFLKKLIKQKSKSNIKTVLLNQKIIAGLGNIYVQEILYSSGIKPQRRIGSLNLKEIKKIVINTKKILQKAIENQGTTVNNYVHLGGSGGFQKYLQVYMGKRCPKKHLLSKVKIGGRGTYYCEKCQK